MMVDDIIKAYDEFVNGIMRTIMLKKRLTKSFVLEKIEEMLYNIGIKYPKDELDFYAGTIYTAYVVYDFTNSSKNEYNKYIRATIEPIVREEALKVIREALFDYFNDSEVIVWVPLYNRPCNALCEKRSNMIVMKSEAEKEFEKLCAPGYSWLHPHKNCRCLFLPLYEKEG